MTDSPGDPSRSPADPSSDLTPALARMGGVLLSAQTIGTVLELVTRLAMETIPGSAGAGVTLVDARGKRTTAASDPIVERTTTGPNGCSACSLSRPPCCSPTPRTSTTPVGWAAS
jgi:hypothetical protein